MLRTCKLKGLSMQFSHDFPRKFSHCFKLKFSESQEAINFRSNCSIIEASMNSNSWTLAPTLKEIRGNSSTDFHSSCTSHQHPINQLEKHLSWGTFSPPPSTYRTTEKHNLLSVNPKTKWEEIFPFRLMWKYFPRFRPFMRMSKEQQHRMRFWVCSRGAQRSFSHALKQRAVWRWFAVVPDEENPFVLPSLFTLTENLQRHEWKSREKMENSQARLGMLAAHCQGWKTPAEVSLSFELHNATKIKIHFNEV